MNNKHNTFKFIVASFALLGCAGLQRDCASCNASNYGADWVVAQYRYDGAPMRCWQLRNTAIENEQASDGIYWLDQETGNLIHISGWYNRVQVNRGDFAAAARSINVDPSTCVGNK